MSTASGTRTKVAFYGQPRAVMTPTPFSVPQAYATGKIDSGWLGDEVVTTVEDVDALVDLPTANVKLPKLVLMWDAVTQTHEVWKLTDGNLAHGPANGVVRPNDYNAATNARYWKRG